MKYYVFRPDSNVRVEGPFSKEEAELYAQQLNDFVHRNSPLGRIFPGAKVTGPFYAVPWKALPARAQADYRRLQRI